MSKKTFEQAIASDLMIFDGAMGTEIYRRNVLTIQCFDELCLSQPDMIKAIHASYRDAGADVLTTNTFGANRVALSKSGLTGLLESINQAGVELAREVARDAGRAMYVAGSVGPVLSKGRSRNELVNVLREQALVLAEAGADVILFETQRTRSDFEAAVEAMRDVPGTPFALSCAVFSGNESGAGESLKRLLAPIPQGEPQPVAWGLNCGQGPDGLLSAVEQALNLVDRPLFVLPNAGIPRELEGRQMYYCSPDYMAGYAKRYLDLGVDGIGGCCGTNPDHIREIAQRLKPLGQTKLQHRIIDTTPEAELKPATPFDKKSRLAWKLANSEWVSTVELVPPRGYALEPTIEKARALYRRGVDAINLPDGPRASSRLSPLITAVRMQEHAQIEAILHFCCRDRNLIGMQADMLACAACGVRNILFVTGDPPKLGDYPFSSGVFDVDSIGVCAIQSRLNQGVDLGGQAIDPPTDAVIGVGADPNALEPERELRRFYEKVEAGAEFAITQPVFDADSLFAFLDKVEDAGIPVLAGIWPLANYRNALFLKNEIPGVVLPDAIMERMASVEDREDQRQMGIAIAREMVEKLRARVAGIQVSAPFGNIETALSVIES